MDNNSKIDIFIQEFTRKYTFPKLTPSDIDRLADDYLFIFSESSLDKQEKKELLYRLCENLKSTNNIQNFFKKLDTIKGQPKKQNLEGVVMDLHPIDENIEDLDYDFGRYALTDDYYDVAEEAEERYKYN